MITEGNSGEEGRRSVGSCLPDLRSCLPVTLVLRGCVASVRRAAACLVSPPSLPFRVDIFFFQLCCILACTTSRSIVPLEYASRNVLVSMLYNFELHIKKYSEQAALFTSAMTSLVIAEVK
jgi:hypothetical protein